MKRCVICIMTILLFLPFVSAEAETKAVTAIAKLSAEEPSLLFFDKVKYGNYAYPKMDVIEDEQAWKIDRYDKNGYYIGFDLNDDFAKNISAGSVFEIEIDYYNKGSGFFHLVYDSERKSERISDAVLTTNSGLKETAVFTVEDGYFDNRVKGEYDFILTVETPRYYESAVSGASVTISEVRVKKYEGMNKVTHFGYTKETGNIFPQHSENKLIYNELTNVTGKRLSVDVTYRAVGSDGVAHWENTEKIALGAGETKKYSTNIDIGECGLYTLYVDIKNELKGIDISYKRYDFAIVKTDPYGIKNENYYLAAHFQHYGDNTDDGLDVIAKSNTYGIRTEFGWTHVYDSNNRKNNIYKEEDKIFHNKLRENDLHLLAIYAFSVAAETGGWKYLPVTESALESWEQGMEYVAKETKDIVERIEIWNEPDILAFNGGTDYTGELNEFGVKSSPEEYATAAKRAYVAAKKGNPDAEVGVMCLVELRRDSSMDFFRRAMIESGLQNYCDAVTMHPYSDGSAEHYHNMSDFEKRLMQMIDKDRDIRVWNTEYGFSTMDNASRTDMKQARHMVRTPIHLMGEGVGDVNVGYNFAQKGLIPINREDNFGIVSPGFEGGDSKFDKHFVPKQAYVAITAMNYYMAQARPDGNGNYGAEVPEDAKNEYDSEHIYKFISHKFDADVYVMWRTEKETEKELDFGADSVILADMYGNEQILRSENGRYTFNIGMSPQYVIVKKESNNGFSVDEIKFMHNKDGKWIDVTEMDNAEREITVRVTGYNPTTGEKKVNVILAGYREKDRNKCLKYAEVVNIPVSAEGLFCYEKKFNKDEFDELRCMVWDEETMTPCVNSKTIQ